MDAIPKLIYKLFKKKQKIKFENNFKREYSKSKFREVNLEQPCHVGRASYLANVNKHNMIFDSETVCSNHALIFYNKHLNQVISKYLLI
jgi:hypothetical protein